jgi:DmsE family decaheme c-type cytochrome
MQLKSILAAAGMLVAFAVLMPATALAQQPVAGSPAVTPVCANCHENQHLSTMLTAHGAKNDANGSMCQACHGDTSAHLQDPMKNKPANPLKTGAPAAQKSEVCMTCHAGNRHLVFWETGKHARNEIACSSCHSIHGKPGNAVVRPFTTTFLPNESDLCGTCHQQIRAATFKPSHHPIQEGKIKCSDCHNVHGALTPAMLKSETVNQQCYSCHADKRGPYLFAHPAVEENCLSCHNPHGSVYYKLLNERQPNLCQECHDAARHPGTFYGSGGQFTCTPEAIADPINYPGCKGKQPGAFNAGVNTRMIARSCTNCHNNIHGSNAPSNRGKYFFR